MIKQILTCTDGSKHSYAAAEYAVHLAARLTAGVHGLHIIDIRQLEGPFISDLSGWIGAQTYEAHLSKAKTMLHERGRNILDAVEALAKQAGVPVDTDIKTGHPLRVMLEAEAHADLVVIGRSGEHAEMNPEMLGSTADRMARHTEKPCLLTSAAFSEPERIMIACDGSVRASKALDAGLELAKALERETVLVTATGGLSAEDAKSASHQAAEVAAQHGVKAQLLYEDGAPEEIIPDQMKKTGCNLLVMGAHGHSRVHELILGSTTTELISQLEQPVLVVR